MPMTPRERWLALFNRQPADRVPTDYGATPEFHTKLCQALDCSSDEALWRRLDIDRPQWLSPRWKLPHHPDDPQADMWGIRFRRVDYATGAYQERVGEPLGRAQSADDVLAFRWPDPDDFDYRPITDAVRDDDGYRILAGGWYEPFLMYAAMRGMERAYEDLLAAPEIAEAALGKMFAFCYEQNRRILEAGRGRIELFEVAEDLGGQTGPLFSLEVYRRFFLSNQIRMADLARAYGAHVLYHTDGAAQAFLPDLVGQVKIELLDPIQWRCPGMERETLARDYGARLVFHGGIDNQQTLPFGTPRQVAEEVRETAEIFRECRWICTPCHNIQAVSPVENVIAMYKAAGELKPPE